MKDWAEPYELWECKLAIIIITNVIIMKDWADLMNYGSVSWLLYY